jgi:hypothetical protein
MRLKARRGAGATRTLAGQRNAANAKETAQERALWVGRQLIEAGLPPTLPEEWLAIVQLINDYEKAAGRKKCKESRRVKKTAKGGRV